MQVAVELRRFLRRQISFPGALGQRVHTLCVVCVKVNREQMPPSLACKRRPRMAASVLGVMTWELIGGSLPISCLICGSIGKLPKSQPETSLQRSPATSSATHEVSGWSNRPIYHVRYHFRLYVGVSILSSVPLNVHVRNRGRRISSIHNSRHNE